MDMLTRIRIEAAAQTTEDVTHDLWEMAWAIAYALVPKGEPTDSPHVHEEVISRLPPEEATDAHVYKGRLVIGFPVDWDHAKGWFEIACARRGVRAPHHGQTSPAMRDEMLEEWAKDQAPSEYIEPPGSPRTPVYDDSPSPTQSP